MSELPERLSRRYVLRGAFAAGAITLSGGLGRAASSDLDAALSRGGHVIYFRHAATTWSGIDRIEWPRAQQRLLSAEGIAQSERIGRAFRAAGIPVGDVLASPFARCRDMAEIAFGRVEERDELLGLLSDASGRPARVAYLRAMLERAPQPGTNRIIIAHRSNIAEVAGVALAEGEGVILEPQGDRFRVLETRMPADWPMV